MFNDTLTSVAKALAAHCRNHTEREGLNTLYAADAVSVEAADPGDGQVKDGLDAIRAKHDWWESAFDVHEASVDGPYLHGDDRFGLVFAIDATKRDTGERMAMKELGIYTVREGKIAREEFFYIAP